MSRLDKLAQWFNTHPRKTLAIICLLAFAVRLSAINWGLPTDPYGGYYHPDEGKIVSAAIKFPADILTRTDLRYGTAYHYFCGVLTLPVKWLARMFGHSLTGPRGKLLYYYLTRIITILLGTGCSILVYSIGRRLYGPKQGLVAALLIAITQIHVLHSATATLDVPTSFLASLCVLLACLYLDQPKTWRLVALAACCGVLIGTKYPGAALLPTVALAYLYAWPKRKASGKPMAAFWGGALLTLAIVVASYLITNPTVLIRPDALVAAIVEEITGAATDGRDLMSWAGFAETFDLRSWWDTWGSLGYRAQSMPLALASLLGLLHAFMRCNKSSSLMLIFVVGYAAVMGREIDGRYTIMIAPALAIYASSALAWVAKHYKTKGVALAIVVVLSAFLATGKGLVTVRQPDTRSLATQYIETNLPYGARIGVQGGGHDRRGTWLWPRLDRARFVILDLTDDVDYIILNGRDIDKMQDAWNTPGATEPGNPIAARFWDPDPVPAKAMFARYAELLAAIDSSSESYHLQQAYRAKPLVYMAFAPPDILVFRVLDAPDHVDQPPSSALSVNTHFGNVACLEAIEILPTACAGEKLDVVLYWRGLEMVDADYTVSIQLLDANWNKIGQNDQQPAQGWRPTSRWMLGELVLDQHKLAISTNASPGEYRVEIIMYNALTHDKVQVTTPDGHVIGESLTATSLTITEESSAP